MSILYPRSKERMMTTRSQSWCVAPISHPDVAQGSRNTKVFGYSVSLISSGLTWSNRLTYALRPFFPYPAFISSLEPDQQQLPPLPSEPNPQTPLLIPLYLLASLDRSALFNRLNSRIRDQRNPSQLPLSVRTGFLVMGQAI